MRCSSHSQRFLDRLKSPHGVNTVIGEMWKVTEKNGFLELRLSLSSGQLVTIESVNDPVGPQVLAVRFDESAFPAGLEGRWLDRLTGRKSSNKKSRRALAVA